MTYIYYVDNSINVLHQIEDYFIKNNIKFNTKRMQVLNILEIKQFLKLSANLEEILNRNFIKNLNWNIKMNDLFLQILKNPSILKSPIVVNFNKKIIFTGYNENKLDTFIRIVEDKENKNE